MYFLPILLYSVYSVYWCLWTLVCAQLSSRSGWELDFDFDSVTSRWPKQAHTITPPPLWVIVGISFLCWYAVCRLFQICNYAKTSPVLNVLHVFSLFFYRLRMEKPTEYKQMDNSTQEASPTGRISIVCLRSCH